MNETELIKLCVKKNEKAWGLFIERYAKLVDWAVRKRLLSSGFRCDEGDIEDIFQEVFLTVLKGEKLRQIKDAKCIPGWLSMVASNKTVDFMRQKVCREQNLVFDAEACKEYSFDQEPCSRDILTVIREVISTLSDKERIIISLNLLEERTHQEIARILKIPVNTVSTIIARSKKKLRERLKGRGVEDDFLRS